MQRGCKGGLDKSRFAPPLERERERELIGRLPKRPWRIPSSGDADIFGHFGGARSRPSLSGGCPPSWRR
eukprot:432545-Prorocentrum_minimum.AAC.1